MDKRILTFAVCCAGLLSFAQENRRAPWFQPVQAASGGAGGSLYNDLIVNDLANVSTAASQTSYTTPAYQPAPGALVLVTVINTKSSAPDIPTFSGNGLTWVQITSTNFNTIASPTTRITVFRAQGASPTSSAGTAGFAGATQTGCIIHVLEVQGADAGAANGANAIVQVAVTNQDNGTNPQIGFATPSGVGTNALLFIYGDNQNSAASRSPPTNWVMLAQQNYGVPSTGCGIQFQCNALSAISAMATGDGRNWGGILLEIKPALEVDPTTVPTLVQSLATYTPDEVGNNYTNWLPNATLAGNFLAVHVVFISSVGRTLSLTDDKSNTYTRAQSVNSISGLFYEEWFATNVAANTRALYFTVNPNNGTIFHTEITEWAHIAQYNPVDGTASSTYAAAACPATGPVTTASDGDLLISYYSDFEPANYPANFCGGGGHWLSTQRVLGHGSQYAIQAKSSSGTSPVAYFGSPATEYWQNTVVAYKRGPGGTLPSTNRIRIVHLQWVHDLTESPVQVFFPMEGNLAVFTSTYYKAAGHFTAVNPNVTGVWNEVVTTNADAAQMWYSTNQTPRNNPPTGLTLTHIGYESLACLWDIANANSAPYDKQAEHVAILLPAGDVTDNPVITPSTANGIVISVCQFTVGPEDRSLDPAQIFDSPSYTGITDASHYSNGDSTQHVFNSDTSTIHFGQHLIGGPSDVGSLAVSFKGE